ncbi:MAG TPA: hypothetical protein VNO52_05625, partial [Methylomirabilota bacterium]|nr:hypothetical protein [Methylomirabilota bacterium]
GGSDDKSRPAEPAAGPGKKFRAKDITIRGGKIHLSVQGLGGKAAVVPLPDIHLQNIGNDEEGVPLAKLSREILRPMLKAAIESGGKALADVGKGATEAVKDAAGEAGKAVEGIKNLFKKK